MKTLLLSVVIAAFAVTLQAGDAKTCQDKSACCSQSKAAQQTKASTCCPNAAKAAKVAVKPLLSPKAAAELASK